MRPDASLQMTEVPANPAKRLCFGKEETGLEDKRLREQQGLIPSRPFPTCLRRPYLFSHKRKDMEEKSAWKRLVHSAGPTVGISPCEAYKNSVRNFVLLQISREKTRKTEAVFLVAFKVAPGESEIFPARFLFVTFSFGEAKENVMPQPLRLPSRTGRCGRIRRTAHLSLPCTA